MTCALKLFEVLASGLRDEQNNIESLLKSRASPDVINARLQELLHLLDGLKVHGKKAELICLAPATRAGSRCLAKDMNSLGSTRVSERQ